MGAQSSTTLKAIQSTLWPRHPPADLERASPPPLFYGCGPTIVYSHSKDTTRRINFETDTITIYGWPTRGGVIMLQDASPADLDFLRMDRMDPPMLRHESGEQEDAFCQRLLLLGGKWWDSYTRYWLLTNEEVDNNLDESDEPLPTLGERFWVSVAWPSSGGIVVSEGDTNMWSPPIEADTVWAPEGTARLRLCTNMDEKAQMLKDRFQGKMWGDVKDYQGNAFINCWESKESGEVGEFQKTWPDT